MQTFRITPHRKVYRIEAVTEGGDTRVIQTHQTERAALVHLKALQAKADVEWVRYALRQGYG
jgi:hypothetical protein